MRSIAWLLWIICVQAASGVEAADAGDDFSNNLISDLAPLLSLFGEQFAQQFMSESMGWLDHIVFAMAPLGILTTIVAAIRVGGPAWLRAVIGRARENRGTVELQLMSSTSHEVCELWNGQGIVRTMGKPQVQEIIYLPKHCDNTSTFGLYTLESATAEGLFQERKLRDPVTLIWTGRPNIDEENVNELLKKVQPPQQKSAPNISLNLHGGSNVRDLLFAAVFGIVLQSGTLVFSGFSVYHPQLSLRFLKDGRPARPYAYPVMACGTVLLTVGLMICSAIVEYSTQEREFIARRENVADPADCKLYGQILWLQRSHVVSDQAFNASVIFRAPRGSDNCLNRVLTSQRAEPGPGWPRGFLVPKVICGRASEAMTVLGVLLALCGFVLQFQGLRGLHWTSSIAQLISIILMTALRAWVSRHLILAPIPKQVPAQHELDWLALWFARRLEGEENNAGGDRSGVQWPKDENEVEQEAEVLKGTLTRHVQTLNQRRNHVQGRTRSEPEAEPGRRNVSVGVGARFGAARQIYAQCPPTERLIWAIGLRGHNGRVDPTKSPSPPNQLRRRNHRNIGTNNIATPTTTKAVATQTTADDPADRRVAGLSLSHNVADYTACGVNIVQVRDADLEGKESVLSRSCNRAQRALKIRERLAQLTNWQGHSAAAAIALARSISWTLNTLFLGAGPEHHEVAESFCWSIDVQLDLDDSVETIELQAVRDTSTRRWVVDTMQIEAVLSLWLFHIHEMRGIISREVDSTEQVDKQGSESDIGAKLRIVRLLGPDTPDLRRDLGWWVSDSTCFEFETSDSGRKDVDVGGTKDVFDGPVGLPGWGETVEAADLQPVLTVVATGSLESLLSQHLFTVFIWAVVNDHRVQIDHKGTTIALPNAFRLEEPSTLLSLRLESKILQELAKTIQGTGLCTLQDAFLCLIPPLSCKQLLPSLEVIKFVRMQTKGAEQMGQWSSVVPIYIRLAREFNAFGNSNQSFLQANAILVETLISITDIIRIKGDPADPNLTADLEGLRTDIEKELKNLPDEVRQTFAKIYGMQMRFDAYDEFWSRLGISLDKDIGRTQGDIGLNTKAMDILGWSGLHYAAISSLPDEVSCEKIRSFLHLGVNANERDMAGQTPLYYAVENVAGNKSKGQGSTSTEKIRELIRGGADPNICARNGRSPLHCAAENGDRSLAELLLVEGARMEAQDHMGQRPLHLAAFGGNVEVINILLEKGAHTTARDHDGRTPLHIAAFAGSGSVASRLLQVPNIETEIKDRFEQTPLDVAGRGADIETFDIIFNATLGADGGKTEDGCSSFLYAVRCGKIQILHHWLQPSSAGLPLDVSRLALLEECDDSGLKAVHIAVKHDNHKALMVLLNTGFLVKARSSVEGLTPLHVAALHGRVIALELLIQRGASLDARTRGFGHEGFNALHIAAKSGHLEVVARLLQLATTSGKKDLIESRTLSQGLTALHLATRYGHQSILQFLIDSGAQLEARTEGTTGRGYGAFHIAVKYGQCDAIVRLLDAGISVDTTTSYKALTALHIAARYNQVAALRLLIQAGSDLEANTDGYYSKYDGFNALHLAVIYGHRDAALALLNSDIGINSRTSTRGFTPLHLVARYGDVGGLIPLLIERGAGLEESSRAGFKALYLAVMGGHRDIVEQLLDADAQAESRYQVNPGDIDDIHINAGPDDYELNICPDAVSVAASYGYTDIVKILVDAGATVDTQLLFELKVATLTVSGSGKIGIYPGALFAAVCGGHLETARFLIQHIQSSKATETDMTLNPGKFAFKHVRARGRAKLTIGYTVSLDIETLEARGDSQLKIYRGLLSAATGEGYTDMLHYLLRSANPSLKACPPALVRISNQLWLAESAQLNIDYSILHLMHASIEGRFIAYRGALLAAIHTGQTELVRSLLDAPEVNPNENQGGYIDIGTGCGQLTLTHNGTINIDCEELIYLPLGLQVEARCKFNIYAGALSAAAANGHPKILALLLKAGAISDSPRQVTRGLPHSPLAKDWAGVKISMNATQAAISSGNTYIIDILEKYGVFEEVGNQFEHEGAGTKAKEKGRGRGTRVEIGDVHIIPSRGNQQVMEQHRRRGASVPGHMMYGEGGSGQGWRSQNDQELDIERRLEDLKEGKPRDTIDKQLSDQPPRDGQQWDEHKLKEPEKQAEQQEEVGDKKQLQEQQHEQQDEKRGEQTGTDPSDEQYHEQQHDQKYDYEQQQHEEQEIINTPAEQEAPDTSTSKDPDEEPDLDVHRQQEADEHDLNEPRLGQQEGGDDEILSCSSTHSKAIEMKNPGVPGGPL